MKGGGAIVGSEAEGRGALAEGSVAIWKGEAQAILSLFLGDLI